MLPLGRYCHYFKQQQRLKLPSLPLDLIAVAKPFFDKGMIRVRAVQQNMQKEVFYHEVRHHLKMLITMAVNSVAPSETVKFLFITMAAGRYFDYS